MSQASREVMRQHNTCLKPSRTASQLHTFGSLYDSRCAGEGTGLPAKMLAAACSGAQPGLQWLQLLAGLQGQAAFQSMQPNSWIAAGRIRRRPASSGSGPAPGLWQCPARSCWLLCASLSLGQGPSGRSIISKRRCSSNPIGLSLRLSQYHTAVWTTTAWTRSQLLSSWSERHR